jgi:hypothetical protein
MRETRVLAPTFHFADGSLVHTSNAVVVRAAPTLIAFVIVMLLQFITIAVFARGLAVRQRAGARQLELAAWQVRQLVDFAAVSSESLGPELR